MSGKPIAARAQRGRRTALLVVVALLSATASTGCTNATTAPPTPTPVVATISGRSLQFGAARYELVTSGAGAQDGGFAISADGRFLAFASAESSVVAGFDNDTLNVFVRDRSSDSVERVSGFSEIEQGTGVEDARWQAHDPAMTPDGRFVAYISSTPDLADDDPDYHLDRVLIRDRVLNETELVSVDVTASRPGQNCMFWGLSISDDGRYVAFNSRVDDEGQVYVRDRQKKSTTALGEVQDENGSIQVAGLDQYTNVLMEYLEGGQHLTCSSYARDAQGERVFVGTYLIDRMSGTTELLTVGLNGARPIAPTEYGPDDMLLLPDAWGLCLSGNGRYAAFSSGASNLVEGDTNGADDIFVFDRQAKKLVRASVNSDGGEGAGGTCSEPSISADGSRVAFVSSAVGLAGNRVYPRPNNLALSDVYLRDMSASTTVRASDFGPQYDGAGGSSYRPILTADGSQLVFLTYAWTLISGDDAIGVIDGGDVVVRRFPVQ